MSSVFLISDAAKKVEVEAHVLRYWEEELGLPIKRNELGHRYYTEEDVKRFREIKNLKERGLQLKAIRMILKNGKLDMLPVKYDEQADSFPKESADGKNADEAEVIKRGENASDLNERTEAREEEEIETSVEVESEKCHLVHPAQQMLREESRGGKSSTFAMAVAAAFQGNFTGK